MALEKSVGKREQLRKSQGEIVGRRSNGAGLQRIYNWNPASE